MGACWLVVPYWTQTDIVTQIYRCPTLVSWLVVDLVSFSSNENPWFKIIGMINNCVDNTNPLIPPNKINWSQLILWQDNSTKPFLEISLQMDLVSLHIIVLLLKIKVITCLYPIISEFIAIKTHQKIIYVMSNYINLQVQAYLTWILYVL